MLKLQSAQDTVSVSNVLRFFSIHLGHADSKNSPAKTALMNGFRRVTSRQTSIYTHGNDIRTFLPSPKVRQTLCGRMCSDKPLLPSLSVVLLKCSPDAGDKKARGELERETREAGKPMMAEWNESRRWQEPESPAAQI